MDGLNTAATSVRLVIQSRVDLVDLVHEAASKVAAIAGFDENASLDVGIAVREAVINAIEHGNEGDPTRTVEVELNAGNGQVSARVLDQGSGFDPEGAPDPTRQENLLECSGRGLLMIRAFVDDVRFRHVEGRGMEVTLVKNVRPAEGDATAKSGGADNGGASE